MGLDSTGDHPRGCGEHDARRQNSSQRLGSSPRMRGAHDPAGRPGQGVGIIPADAGSTKGWHRLERRSADHPRGCGEHHHAASVVKVTPGSSPRMRGALVNSAKTAWSAGIIPADAGSTGTMTRLTMGGQDHPRGCGEHPQKRKERESHPGSSPRMRGAQ